MRNNIFNVVLEFGDVKETTTEGDNTSIVTDKAPQIKVAEIIREFIAFRREPRERTEYVSDFLLLLRFSCCLPIKCLLLLNIYIYVCVCVCVCVYICILCIYIYNKVRI